MDGANTHKNYTMKSLLTAFLFLSTFLIAAQSGKNDIIMTKSGDLIQAKVVKVTSNTISFTYPGETVINEVEKNTLEKIVFASGRTQTFGNSPATPPTSRAETAIIPAEEPQVIPKEEIYLPPSYQKGSIAVIPASFMVNDSYKKELASDLSSYISSYLAKTSATHGLAVEDMTSTIKKLVDSGIGYQELKTASLEQLRNAIKAEFLVKMAIEETKAVPPAKKGFYGDEEVVPTVSNSQTSIQLKVYGPESENEIHAGTVSYQQMGNSSESNWQSLTEYLIDRYVATKS